jgi:nucleotide-binding universal stress UspA family protein
MSSTETVIGYGGRRRIVVGVDGSDQSIAAVEWAADEARARDVALEVATTWIYPIGTLLVPVGPEPPQRSAMIMEAKALLDRVLEKAAGALDGVEVLRRVREGSPSQALIEESKDADLLVVGKRGLGGFKGLLLGSVSQLCVAHAYCPVVVVPYQESEG